MSDSEIPMQVKVPKFIDIQDRVVFGLTWQQVAYLGAGAGATIVFLLLFTPLLAFPLSAAAIALSTAFAFAKVNERPFRAFFSALLHYHANPKRLFWERERPKVVLAPSRTEGTQETSTTKTLTREKLQELAAALDMAKRRRR